MKNFKNLIFAALAALFFGGCAGSSPQIYDYSLFLQSKPKSILVLMPTNDSIEEKASKAVLAHALYPLSEAGYYIFPMALVNDTFKHNGITEPSEMAQISLHKLKQIFGADAVLYIHVNSYGTSYMVIDSVTKVGVEARLVDINNGNLLWQKSVVVTDQSSNQGSSGILGALISAALKQIIDTSTDASFKLSAQADRVLFATDCRDCILHGAYSPNFGKDAQLSTSK